AGGGGGGRGAGGGGGGAARDRVGGRGERAVEPRNGRGEGGMEERRGGMGVHGGHEEVEVPVAVDVAPRDPRAGAPVDHAGRRRPLAERAVALVVVEGVLPELVGDVESGQPSPS